MGQLRRRIETLVIVILCIPFLLEGRLTLEHVISKRMLPDNQRCNPSEGTCSKGDFVDKAIADCRYEAKSVLETCTVRGETGGVISWVVAPERNDRCKPVQSGKKFSCGDRGTNTRCVCSDHKIEPDECRCQYWTEATPGSNDPAFCTAYYLAGDSHVHHYACCNNCNDTTNTASTDSWKSCDGHTYEGGSSTEYCNSCGVATGGGLVKYNFNCGNCQIQSHCEDKCNNIIGLTLPGFCWKWVNCFKGCCMATEKTMTERVDQMTTSELKKRHSDWWNGNFVITNIDEFCGDGKCSEGEDRYSCPADCCALISSKCSSAPSVCTEDCCQLDSCCLE